MSNPSVTNETLIEPPADWTTKAIAAQQYYNNSALQKDHAAELIDMLDVPHGGSVLDLGCGTGHLATVLSDFVGQDGKVVAVDPDAERIALAKKTNARPNVQYFVANDQTFPGERYDLIVSTHVIHWIKDKRALFTRIFDKLTPGGIFGFVTYDGMPTFSSGVYDGLGALVSPDFLPNLLNVTIQFEDTQGYTNLGSEAGLGDFSAQVLQKELQYTSAEELLHFWAGATHGTFSVADVSKSKLQDYKESREQDLLASVSILATLCMTMKRL